MVTQQVKPLTLDDFDAWVALPGNADSTFELIAGEIVPMSPSNLYSSYISGWIQTRINMYLLEHPIGYTTGEQGGYQVLDECYAPDVAFISNKRQPELPREGYNPNPPDLAVEVVSPSDSEKRLRIKIANYVAAGVVVWVVYPDIPEVEVYAPGQAVKLIGREGTLDGGDVLPGFSLPVKSVFPG